MVVVFQTKYYQNNTYNGGELYKRCLYFFLMMYLMDTLNGSVTFYMINSVRKYLFHQSVVNQAKISSQGTTTSENFHEAIFK